MKVTLPPLDTKVVPLDPDGRRYRMYYEGTAGAGDEARHDSGIRSAVSDDSGLTFVPEPGWRWSRVKLFHAPSYIPFVILRTKHRGGVVMIASPTARWRLSSPGASMNSPRVLPLQDGVSHRMYASLNGPGGAGISPGC